MVVINDDIRCNVNNFSKGRRSKIKYIVVHYTASPNDTAEGEAKYFKNNIIEASAHYFVDGKSVYRADIYENGENSLKALFSTKNLRPRNCTKVCDY